MKFDQQIPRNALVWLILSQFALLLPHVERVPAWVVLVYFFTAFWRFMVHQGRWSLPGKLVKTTLTLSSFAGIYISYRSFIGLEPTVTLLLVAFALKLIELVERRDAFLLLFLAYFVCVTEFLFSQVLLVTLYMLIPLVLITTTLVALNLPDGLNFSTRPLQRASLMLLQSFPLMLVLFFVFPRIGPLWSVPLKSHAAKTGVSDFMSPGDISSLGLSDEVAFRVQFEGDIPPRNQLYWRGLVFSRLQDDAWRSLRWREIPTLERRQQVPAQLYGKSFRYSVIMEPTQQNWLYSMRYASTRNPAVLKTNDFRLASPGVVEDQRSYKVESWPEVPLETQLSPWRREVETRLPARGNPLSREMAQRLYSAVNFDPSLFAEEVLALFNQGEFYYTVKPPLLDDDPIDQFLFETRRGFCEHYAAAFVYMMRSVEIPARVVAGYQGGEINPVNSTVIVHQFDAHAWAEIWLPERGWVRVDPTAVIAPDRIEWGLERALQEEGSFLSESPFSPLRYRDIAWLNLLRLRLDALDYSWQRFVLEYDSSEQFRLLDGLLGKVSVGRIAALLGVVWALVLLPVAFSLMRRGSDQRLEPASQVYLDFCRKLARIGLPRQSAEAPGSYATRVMQARPDLAPQVTSITSLYDALSYRSVASSKGLQLLKQQVRRFAPASTSPS